MHAFYKSWVLAVFMVIGCDGSSSSGGTSNFDTTKACANLMLYCPTGYTWSQFIGTEADCRTTFGCVYSFYTGSCQQMIGNTVACLAALTSASGCSACNDAILPTQTSCDEPTSCL
jgi:hypothetical protein